MKVLVDTIKSRKVPLTALVDSDLIVIIMVMMMMVMVQVLLSWLEDLPHQPGQGARSPHRQRMLTNGSFVKVRPDVETYFELPRIYLQSLQILAYCHRMYFLYCMDIYYDVSKWNVSRLVWYRPTRYYKPDQ